MERTNEVMMIKVEGIRKEYPLVVGATVVLDGVNLTVRRGESVAIMGPSGSGKSTLLHILGTLDAPTSGRVALDGQDPFTLKEPELADFRNRKLGFVFQDHVLLPQCTALENILVPTLAAAGNRAVSVRRATGLLEIVGLTERRDARPAELSGGERQRVAIARALINKPGILLCDEPTGNLDAASGDRIGELFQTIQHSEQVAMVVVTHNAAFAQRFDRVLHLADGRLDG